MSNLIREKVTRVHHWTDNLFSFTTTRDPAFRFRNGHFTMLGLEAENGRPLLRAYSIASANYEPELEFFSIKVPDGPLTSRLQHLQVGDEVLLSTKPTGTLTVDHLLPGRHLYLLSTGTGLAPFLSVIKDFETYEHFDRVILVHGCRHIADLAYRDTITEELPNNEYFGELAAIHRGPRPYEVACAAEGTLWALSREAYTRAMCAPPSKERLMCGFPRGWTSACCGGRATRSAASSPSATARPPGWRGGGRTA